jgi:hypothetical protein
MAGEERGVAIAFASSFVILTNVRIQIRNGWY